MPLFSREVGEAARAHAIRAWPNESCGVVARGVYLALPNEAADPRENFKLPVRTFADLEVAAVVHSHCAPRHDPWPTRADMEGQVQTNVPWGIVWGNGVEARGPLWWGDFVLDEDLIGRPFQPGVTDCYSLVRAAFWQERGIRLPEYPRDPDWWKTPGVDILSQGFASAGFRALDAEKETPVPGDCLLMKVRSDVPNHCAVIRENGLILHHLGNRVSRREPQGPWQRFVTHTLRYEG